jgi:asparagine synthase (glutamine-hydrolysing)
MCGVAGMFGVSCEPAQLDAMVASQRHRGPDANGVYVDSLHQAGLGHNRLSIIDLSAAGRQPMVNRDGQVRIVFNGEIYNYLELRSELSDYPFQTHTDTEVILAAYERWGEACLDRLIGMFAFLLWDERKRRLFAARDRFGVKPLYYHQRADGTLLLASEIKALHAAGVPVDADPVTWATYLTHGLYEHSERTFWTGVYSVPPGHKLLWENGEARVSCWYDLAERCGLGFDERPVEQVKEEYLSILEESVRLRFRSDVPVGINLSGGVDSSALLGLVHKVKGSESEIKVFTFITGDEHYDELPWVRQMLDHTRHPLQICSLRPEEVPALAESVQNYQDEPFGGLPTLCYTRIFERARQEGVIVLLDGQGMDEQWAGYDYYQAATSSGNSGLVQGTKESPVRPECLTKEFRDLAQRFEPLQPFSDSLRNVQYRDIRYTKIPRALRFNDRISMRSSTELREPFLDHRLLELSLCQLPERKIFDGTHKWLLRQVVRDLLPQGITEAPKRPLQTPQREWLRGPLNQWAEDCIQHALSTCGGAWLNNSAVITAWKDYCCGKGDNSFFVWQWLNLGLTTSNLALPAPV